MHPPESTPAPEAANSREGRPRTGAKDVAQLAGVSTATVSRALNNPESVDPVTRQRVLDAVAKLRYMPHGAARSLRSQRSKMVGAVVPSFDYALYARTTSALQQRLDARGYSLVLAETHYDPGAELRVASQLAQHGVDAFVFVGLDHDPTLFALLEDYGRPYVLTWGVDPMCRHPSVGFDNEAATHAMARHLIELGHRRFGLLSAPVAGNDRARARGAGLRAALVEAGLKLDEGCVQYAPISLQSAQEAMTRILDQPEPPTALVATNDVFAVGAMLACRAAGVRIPEDISITGVDNTDLGATQSPGLTSIRTPIVEIGDAAAAQIIARLEDRPCELFQSFPIEIVHRGSTAPPNPKRKYQP
ncbi:LacI family DNA-binding transcriptional regulator [Variovorax dokdonensis]|uniref:LacI family DNA-binding transcriptional regulator n=1 Tax=Variovorax dokdonensis TaxID=344883 RepID=A0ABT7N8Y0_9BURK|nr:LacI family DNA-binding transcriptional regulator [Variovorax dokdonensis]MDM0044393.1 LacI family DNA-binding transcriptional regulator [Variovorax dokdonensis]